ncbi:Retrovirus-related Pol polyprotein from transposon TNT 1-94 [Senna tora]|uniref:Retrovirus-related Pol polyprotein from transposon TNT 1-94 n=1 Tax=Senna tora TaxID=362788 RepID=A0A834WU43_9FABA|nr:Retrovirus-related Pol polyprotein from transposon TNT 1-94 [Senna tora]
MAVNGISSSTQPLIPFIKGENYEFWTIKMRTLFLSQELWELVEHGYSASEADEQKLRENKKKDARALFFLQQAVSDDIFSRISAATTSKGAWQTLKTEFQGSSKVITVKLQSLRRTFEMLQMGNSETVQVFLSRASAVVSQMKAYGEKITDETVVLKLLRSLTPKFDHLVAAIEESEDFTTYSFDDLMGSLQAHEDRLNKSSTRIEEKAFQVKGESSHTKSDVNTSNRSTSRCVYRARGRGGSRGRGGHSGEQRQVKNNSIKCYCCGKIGHNEADCWTKQRNEEKHANVAEEEESMLFMAHSFDKNIANDVWFLDSGCSNHMTGSKQLFKEPDEKETSTVRLGDSSGRESVGQLMANGYRILFDDNSCRVEDRKTGHTFINVQMAHNKMFPLDVSNVNTTLAVSKTCESKLWHLRYGHLHENGTVNSNVASTPMNLNERLQAEDGTEKADATYFRRFMHSPTKHHLGAAKRVLRYVAGTVNFGIWIEESVVDSSPPLPEWFVGVRRCRLRSALHSYNPVFLLCKNGESGKEMMKEDHRKVKRSYREERGSNSSSISTKMLTRKPIS